MNPRDIKRRAREIRKCLIEGAEHYYDRKYKDLRLAFSVPLVTLFCAGSFTGESVTLVANYLFVMAISLPFYALFLFMQKVFSALRKMTVYALVNVGASVLQVVLTIVLSRGFGTWVGFDLEGIAAAQIAFFVFGCIWCYLYLKRKVNLDGIDLPLVFSALRSLVLGVLGALAGFGVLTLLTSFVTPFEGNILIALVYVMIAGIVALVVTYGIALVLHLPEASAVQRLAKRLRRS